MKIDAHFHCWDYNESDYGWIGDDMAVLRRNFSPHDLDSHLDRNGFEGAVLIQTNQNEKENDYLLELAGKNDFIKGVVGWLDLRGIDLEENLEKYKNFQKMRGFRHILEGEANDFMLDNDFIKGIKLLNKFGFTYDILINHFQLSNTEKFIRLIPNQKFVLDHLAKPPIKDQKINAWEKEIRSLSKFENLFVKFLAFLLRQI